MDRFGSRPRATNICMPTHLDPRQGLHQRGRRRGCASSSSKASSRPAAKLNERELSEPLQVSRTPLREAIKMLAAEGLVELLPNRGAVVAQMSEQDVDRHLRGDRRARRAVRRARGAAHRRRRARRDPRAALRDAGGARAGATCRPTTGSTRRSTRTINAAARNAVLTQTYQPSTRGCRRCAFARTSTSDKWERAVDGARRR